MMPGKSPPLTSAPKGGTDGATLANAVRDVLGLAGAGLLSYGCWLVYEPAGFIAGGALMLAAAIAGALRQP